jgi:hypothetical protein
MKRRDGIESKAHWYIEPIGSHTNQVIARRLAELDELAVGINQSMKDNLGVEHSVFAVPSYSFVTEMQKSAADLELKFFVYTRALNHGPIKLWLFGKKKAKSEKVIDAKAKLKKLVKQKGAKP